MAIDATAANLGKEIELARVALIKTSESAPGEWLNPRELKLTTKSDWSPGAANLALGRLIDSGAFEVKEGKVRLKSG